MTDTGGQEIPHARRPEHEVGIRELRNAGRVLAELVAAGAVGRVTSGGRLVGGLVPATPDELRAQELVAQGKLRPGPPAASTAGSRCPRALTGRR